LIYKISSTRFGQSFAHLQERKTEILQHIVSCCCGRQGFGERQRGTSVTSPLSEPLPTTTTGYYML